MIDQFRVTLCCPLPREGFGKAERRCADEIRQMEDLLKEASGDIVVFPEGYLPSQRLPEAEELAGRYGKWLIAGHEDQGEKKTLYTSIIDPQRGCVFSHCKSALTQSDRDHGALEGDRIEVCDSPFGKLGIVLCYEVHFPEVARIEAIKGARILFNTVGTGMWHEQQFDEWTTIARARAIENRCFIVGCTHHCDPIPMIYAYDPHGRELLMKRHHLGMADVGIDMDLIDERDFMRDRNPAAYKDLCKGEFRYE